MVASKTWLLTLDIVLTERICTTVVNNQVFRPQKHYSMGSLASTINLLASINECV